eukprot:SAG31_NODE_2249_length_6085_cov_2.993819_3_plen_212_part_00
MLRTINLQVRALRDLEMHRRDGRVVSISKGTIIVLTQGTQPGRYLQGYEEGHPESEGLFTPTVIRLQVISEHQVAPLTPKLVANEPTDSVSRVSVVDAIRRQVKVAGMQLQLEAAADNHSDRVNNDGSSPLPRSVCGAETESSTAHAAVTSNTSSPSNWSAESSWSAESWAAHSMLSEPKALLGADPNPMFELVITDDDRHLQDCESVWCE